MLSASQKRKVTQAVLSFKLALIGHLVNRDEQEAEAKFFEARSKVAKGQRYNYTDNMSQNKDEFFVLNESWIFSTIERILRNLTTESIGSASS